jgi:predicted RecB family nuclease
MPVGRSAPRLSKSRFVAGLQCHKLLWWKVHEPAAPELVASPDLQARFEAGKRVGEAARTYVPSGELIGFRHYEIDRKVAATQTALGGATPAIYEAALATDDAYAVVDILERRERGFGLIEVKSTTDVKSEHIPDVGVQTYILRHSGITVERAEVMHLNRECRYPDLSNLFVRRDVTPLVEAFLPEVPDAIAAQVATLAGPLPDVPIGDHCFEPHECPFMKRCWPEWPADHVSTLYVMRRRALDLEAKGYRTLHDLPGDLKLSAIQNRQVRAVHAGALVVEESLGEALAPFEGPLAFLDFETVSPAIPVWNGCRPWDQVPVQFSVHVQQPGGGGGYAHHAWLAEGGADPRPEQAELLVAACAGAQAIVAYNSSFERGCIRLLAAAVPGLARELGLLELKLVDLLPVVRNHVYHPRFAGSFSLKSVIPALVPEVTYEDLEIRDGASATLALWRLVFEPARLSRRERAGKRNALLAYCERDSWATVKLLDRLRVLAGLPAAEAPPPAGIPPGTRAVQLDLGL